MVTENTKLNENLECTAARPAQPTMRVKSKKQSFEVPADVQKQIEQEKPVKRTKTKKQLKYAKPERKSIYYELDSLSDYYDEELVFAEKNILYFRLNNLHFNDEYWRHFNNGVKCIMEWKKYDEETAKSKLNGVIDEYIENLKNKKEKENENETK